MKFLLIAAIAAVAAAAPQHGNEGYGHDTYESIPYSYGYAVNDAYGAQFSKQENSDGDNVQGQYSVVLPDGRTQHVTYHADNYGGYNAEVTYDGYASTSAHHAGPTAIHHAAPAYQAVHHAAPAYQAVHHTAPVYQAVHHAAPAYQAVHHAAPACINC